tara:strand:+ start:1324 stop:1602 length:279 start_codon:yes stop_codon:yes gene_type:complete
MTVTFKRDEISMFEAIGGRDDYNGRTILAKFSHTAISGGDWVPVDGDYHTIKLTDDGALGGPRWEYPTGRDLDILLFESFPLGPDVVAGWLA